MVCILAMWCGLAMDLSGGTRRFSIHGARQRTSARVIGVVGQPTPRPNGAERRPDPAQEIKPGESPAFLSTIL